MLDQTSFISEVKPVEIPKGGTKMKLDNFVDSEQRLYGTLVGQLSSSYRILDNGGSQGGFMIYYLYDKNATSYQLCANQNENAE